MVAAKIANLGEGRPRVEINSANWQSFGAPDLHADETPDFFLPPPAPKSAPLPTAPAPAQVSVSDAANMLNVSARSVHRAREVIEDGIPALAAAVEAGDIAVSAAATIARQPQEDQPALVQAHNHRARHDAP